MLKLFFVGVALVELTVAGSLYNEFTVGGLVAGPEPWLDPLLRPHSIHSCVPEPSLHLLVPEPSLHPLLRP